MSIIALERVGKTYPSRAGATEALRDVSLAVERGEFVSLIGPSGCGKSTLLRVVGDLVAPSAGSVTVNGKSPRQARLDRDYGIVFQAPVLYDWRTVEANVRLPLEVMGAPRGEWEPRVRALLRLVGLDGFRRHHPWQLSGGMQQRVAIARALVTNPSILLMDEPFGALDPIIRGQAQKNLIDIQKRFGTTIVLVTHDMEEAIHLGDRIAVMDKGKILQYAAPEEIISRPATAVVDELIGTGDRPFRILSLTQIRDALEPGEASGAPICPYSPPRNPPW